MKNVLLNLNRAFLGVNIALGILYLLGGSYLMVAVSVLCGMLNYMAVKQLTNQ